MIARRAAHLGRLGWTALRHFYDDDGLNLAATVAFWALLSMAPFVYLVGLVLRDLLPADQTAVGRLAVYLPPEAGPVLHELAGSLDRGEGLVVVALPGLLWVATAAFFALEYGVNVAFGTAPRRRFWLSRLKAFLGGLGVLLVLVASLLGDHVALLLDEYRVWLGLPPVLGRVGRLVSYVLHLALNLAAFSVFYKVLPRGRVRWSAATRAATMAVVLWEGTRRIYGGFLLDTPAYGLLTGTLAGTIAVLLWVYTGVAVVLYGAEVAALLNGNRGGPGAPPIP